MQRSWSSLGLCAQPAPCLGSSAVLQAMLHVALKAMLRARLQAMLRTLLRAVCPGTLPALL